LHEPHILRSLSNVKIASVHTSCAGCHFVAISEDGLAYIFGRNTSSALGIPTKTRDAVSESAPLRLRASALPGGRAGTTFVHAACGRSHTILVGSEGQVWTAGANQFGQVRYIRTTAQLMLMSHSAVTLRAGKSPLSGLLRVDGPRPANALLKHQLD
jgi:alpha-tubulin suppressor-like RCC1 family protein